MFNRYPNPVLDQLGFDNVGTRVPMTVDYSQGITQTEFAFVDRSIDFKKLNFSNNFIVNTNPNDYSTILTIIQQSTASGNAIYIENYSDYAAIDLRKFGSSGVGMAIASQAGSCLNLNQTSNTSTIYAQGNAVTGSNGGVIEARALSGATAPAILSGVYGTGNGIVSYVDSTAGSNSSPLVTQQYKATTTDFYRSAVMNGGGVVSITHWVANNADPNGNLTADGVGDVCYSSNGNMYIAQGGTTWLTVTAA